MKKRLLSTLLALCMTLSLLPASAMATGMADLDEFIVEDTAVENEQTVPEAGPAGEPEVPDETGLEDPVPVEDEALPELPVELSNSERIAYPVEGGNIYFDSTTGTVVGCDKSVTTVEFPGSLNGVDVISIGGSAFQFCNKLTRVAIPVGVKSIGSYAFANCESLTHISIPASVTSVGNRGFGSCPISHITFTGTGELSLLIGAQLSVMESKAISIEILNGITVIGDSVFSDSTYSANKIITDIQMPNTVTRIGNSAFKGCSGLTSINLPDDTAKIGTSAFLGCRGLTAVDLPPKISEIEPSAFEGCTGLTNIIIPGNVTSIGDHAFYNCKALSTVTIPDGVTRIGSYAFQDCASLDNITIPDSVLSIGDNAFSRCSHLRSISVPLSANLGGTGVFYGSPVSYIKITGAGTFTVPSTLQACVAHSNNITIDIGDGFSDIGDSAFYGWSNLLVNINIPDSVINIGERAFQDCKNLKKLVLPSSIRKIGKSAFAGCSGLVGDISLPSGMTIIEDESFWGCKNLTSVIIPGSIAIIEDRSFENCSGLTRVTIENGLTEIGQHSFSSCSGLTNIIIPDSVTSIGDSAFLRCTGLSDIVLSDNLTSIGNDAFYGCTGLTELVFPDNTLSIGYRAFDNCSGLTNLVIPNSNIDNLPFYNCSRLTDIYYAGSEADWKNISKSGLANATIHYNYGAPIPDDEKLNWAMADHQYTLAVGEECTLTIQQGDGTTFDASRLVCNATPFGVIEIKEPIRQEGNTAYLTVKGLYPGQATLTVTLSPNLALGENILDRPTVSQIITVIDQQGIQFKNAGERYVVGCGKSKDICALVAGLSQQDVDNVTWSVGDDRGLSTVKSSNINLGSAGSGLGRVYIGLRGIVAGENSVTLTLPDGRNASIPVTVTGARNLDWTNEPPLSSGIITTEGGDLGNGISWTLRRGTLEISGSGAIPDYNSEAETPWAQFRDKVRIVKINSGITGIGNNTFKNCVSLWKTVLPTTLEHIGENVFKGDNKLEVVEFSGTYPADWNALMRRTARGNDPLKSLTRQQITAYTNLDSIAINDAYGISQYATTEEQEALKAFTTLQTEMQKYTERAKNVTTKDQDNILYESGDDENRRRINAIRNGELKSALDTYESVYLTGLTKETRMAVMDAICLGFADRVDEVIEKNFKLGKIDLNAGKINGMKFDMTTEVITVQIIDKVTHYLDKVLKDNVVFKTTATTSSGGIYKIKVINSAALGSRIQIETDDNIVQIGGGTAQPFELGGIDGETIMQQYLKELCGAAKDVMREGIKAYAKYLDDLTGIGGNLANQTEEDVRNMLDAFLHIFDLNDKTNIMVNAHKIHEISKEINAVKKKGDKLKFSDLKTAADNMRQISGLSLEDIRDEATKKIVQSINKSLNKYLDSAIFDPEKTPTETAEEIQKALVEDIKNQYLAKSESVEWSINKVGLRCPVDFRVYDNTDKCIGYVENGTVWYEAPIYILTEGDCKDIYLPGGMDVRFEFTGTGQGEMTYVMEEVRNGETVGRRNYYGIPLTDGVSYTQNFHTGDDLQNLQSDVLTAADGSTIGGSEYLDAWDETQNSAIYIDCVAEGGGVVTGSGNFVKGDAVTLCATPDNEHEFIGWYVDGRLVSAENPYQFAALVSTEIHARFRVPYQESERFDASASSRYNTVAAVYEDEDGLSHIELYQLNHWNSDRFTTVQAKLYRADHTLYSTETLTADFDSKSSYWLPAMDLQDCAKVELYDQSGDIIAALSSPEWSDEIMATLQYRQLQILDSNAALIVSVNNLADEGITGKIVVAAYSGGKLLTCTVISDVTVAAGAGIERQVSVDWQKKESTVEIELFFMDDSWIPLASAITAK